jgi:transcriptional regulator
MYLPKHFASDKLDDIYALVRQYAFASAISVDSVGEPFITHLPLHLELREQQAYLLGHVAKANPHWQLLQAQPRVKVMFMGPQAYLSPSVYPEQQHVPTWNYLVVHADAEASLIDTPEAKDRLLKKLIADHEPEYAAQWRGLEADYQQRMLSGIVAFELKVLAWKAKFKLNAHRPESHSKMHALYQTSQPELAAWMERLGLLKQD